MWKWTLVILALAASLALSVAMLDNMGVVDIRAQVLSQLEKYPAVERHLTVYRLGLEAERAIQRERRDVIFLQAELAGAQEALEKERLALESERLSLEEEWALLAQRERQLDARQMTLDAQMSRIADFERLQILYSNMRPAQLVPIIEELEDDLVARLFSGMDDRTVASVMGQLPAERAASVSRLMGGISSK